MGSEAADAVDDDYLESSGGHTAFNFDSSKKSEPG